LKKISNIVLSPGLGLEDKVLNIFIVDTKQIQISNNNKTKGGLPEEAKAHRAGHPLIIHQQINKNKWG